MIQTQCEVCKESDHKYRCPQCRIMYCSVGCYKTHKDTCTPKEETKVDTPDIEKDLSTKTIPAFELGEEASEDKVNEDRLCLLRESAELKETLKNPHVRQILTALVHSDDPANLLEEAMQEPIFTEFADKCLSIIDGEEEDSS